MRRTADYFIYSCGGDLGIIVDLMADIDCIQSLACCAFEYNLCRPVLVEDSVLEIDEG